MIKGAIKGAGAAFAVFAGTLALSGTSRASYGNSGYSNQLPENEGDAVQHFFGNEASSTEEFGWDFEESYD